MFKLDSKSKNFIKSTFYVSAVSLLAGMGGYLLGYNFLAVFLLFIAIQYILFYAISSMVISFFVEKTKQKVQPGYFGQTLSATFKQRNWFFTRRRR